MSQLASEAIQSNIPAFCDLTIANFEGELTDEDKTILTKIMGEFETQ